MRDYGLENLVYNELKQIDKRTRYVLGSGSIHANEDIITPKVICQCKDTKKLEYRITYDDVKRLYDNALKQNKIPIFIIRIGAGTKDCEIYVYHVIKQEQPFSLLIHENTGRLSRSLGLIYKLAALGSLSDFVEIYYDQFGNKDCETNNK